jgi:succinate dehydrogenase / fumarate reductase, iron-sulfur subunit
MAQRPAILRIQRFDPEKDEKPYMQQYELVAGPGMSVLEALFELTDRQDNSLAFRYSCRGAICGSCSMYINGAYRLACASQLADYREPIVIHPLPGMRVIRDLVVDLDPFWEKYMRVKPYLITYSPDPERERLQSPEQRRIIDEMVNCILCWCCSSACPIVWGDEDYIGPSALIRANRFMSDSRDEGEDARLPTLSDTDGIWRCHTIFNCVEACPKNLNPTASIQALKRRSIRSSFWPWRRHESKWGRVVSDAGEQPHTRDSATSWPRDPRVDRPDNAGRTDGDPRP